MASRIGSYVLTADLGSGAMGKVYRARDIRLDREVALKVLWPQLAEQPAAVARFEREARAEARLRHPNVVAVYDVGAVAGYYYLAMEYVAGCSLRELLKQPMPIEKALHYFKQILSGLGVAHEQGIIHRDLKPGNVLIESATDTLKLADFGLARIIEEENSVTESGEMLGTIEYMAPELLRGEKAGKQSDLYAAGVVLYRMLTGRFPFQGATSAAVLKAHECGIYPLATSVCAGLPVQADRVLARLLACTPTNRYADCQDVFADIERWERGEKIPLEFAAAYEPIDHEIERHRVPRWKRVWQRVITWVRYQWLEIFDQTELTAVRLHDEVMSAERELGVLRRRVEEATLLRNRVRSRADLSWTALKDCEKAAEQAFNANDEAQLHQHLAAKLEEKERAEDLEKEAIEADKVIALAHRQYEDRAAQIAELRHGADLLFARRRRAKLEMSVLGVLPTVKRRLGERLLAAAKLVGIIALIYLSITAILKLKITAAGNRITDQVQIQVASFADTPAQNSLILARAATGGSAVGKISSMAVSTDGEYLLTGDMDKNVRLWETGTGRMVRSYSGLSEAVTRVAFSDDGKYVLGSGDWEIRMWETSTGTFIRRFSERRTVKTFFLSRDGSKMYLVSNFDTWKIIDTNTGTVIKEFRTGNDEQITSAAISRSRRYIAVGCKKGIIQYWDLLTGQFVRSIKLDCADGDRIRAIVFSPDEKYIITTSNTTTTIWSRESGERVYDYGWNNQNVVLMTNDGRKIITCGAEKTSEEVKIWDFVNRCRLASPHISEVQTAELSPDGKYVYFAHNSIAEQWELDTLNRTRTFSDTSYYPPRKIITLAYSEEGLMLGLEGSQRVQPDLRVFTEGRLQNRFSDAEETVQEYGISSNGRFLATRVSPSSYMPPHVCKLWDISKGTLVSTFDDDALSPSLNVISASGKLLASSFGRINLHNLATNKAEGSVGEDRGVSAVGLSADDNYLIGGLRDGRILMWDISVSGHFRSLPEFRLGTNEITAVTTDAEGRFLLAADETGQGRIWNIEAREWVGSFTNTKTVPIAIATSADRKYFYTCGRDGVARIWEFRSGKELVAIQVFVDDEWLATTPDGDFDNSTGIASALSLTGNAGGISPEDYYAQHRRPGLLDALIKSGN